MQTRSPACCAIIVLLTAPALTAQQTTEAATDKSQFTLFNPTPRQLMRDFETDRPDQTESPYTVDAGHFQLEADFASYTYDRRTPGPVKTRFQDLTLGDVNLKLGLLNHLDAQLILTPFRWQRTQDLSTRAAREEQGIGDTLLRLKYNLFGDDDGPIALAVLPYLKLPTNQGQFSNHYLEAGLILPFNWKIRKGTELGAMTEFDASHDNTGAGYHLDWVNSIVFHQDLIPDKLNAYVELYTLLSTEHHAGPLITADVGLIYSLTPDCTLDLGVNAGITKPAPDWNLFTGISFRI